MNINSPEPNQIPQLRDLWKEAFGDNDAFLDIFFSTAFDYSRCQCITLDNKVVAALYWFRCEYHQKPIAYIYAVATAKSHRGQGLCNKLMAHTHQHLSRLGYEGVLLVPGSNELYHFYQKMGYQTCCYHKEFTVLSPSAINSSMQAAEISKANVISDAKETASANEVTEVNNFAKINEYDGITEITGTEYMLLRRNYLPKDGVIQEQENTDFLCTHAKFYKGSDFIFAGSVQDEVFICSELLGNTASADKILAFLKCKRGIFRTIGKDAPFGMYFVLGESTLLPPGYFGFAFD